MIQLCCFFNYAPLYRESVYKLIDEQFYCQFYFGREVQEDKKSGIKKLDYAIFRHPPIEFRNKTLLRRFGWRTKAAFLAFQKYDTFLITGDFVFSYIPLLFLCKLFGKRVFAWGHGIKTRKGKMRLFNDFFYKSLTGFLTYGEGGRKRLIELGYNPEKIHVIYNSLGPRRHSVPQLKSDVFTRHFGDDKPILIFIGRLTPQKRLDWLIKAHADLNRNGQECNLVIVGSGVEMAGLRQCAAKQGYENKVWFYGECYDDNVTRELLYNADLCVSPGNVGLTALNSMEYGTPVLSHSDFETQMPEYETIVEGKTGTLYRKGDYADFYRKISDWLSNTNRDRGQIRQNCYEMINGKWNSDHQLEILNGILTSGDK